jgi:hypothetical protein
MGIINGFTDGHRWNDDMRRNCIPFTENEIDLYRLWWEFLKISDGNRWAGKVKEDFQDITALALPSSSSETFEGWWAEHSHLFWRPKHPAKLMRINDQADYNKKLQAGYMIIAVPLDEKPTRLRKDFNQLLSENCIYIENSNKTIPRNDPATTSNENYSIYQANPESLPRRDLVMKSLYASQLYAERTRLHEDAMKHYNAEISECRSKIENMRANKAARIKNIGAVKATLEMDKEKKQLRSAKGKKPRPKQIWQMVELFHSRRKASGVMEITLEASKMPRYREYAKNIILNVQQGVFPKHG